MIEFEMGPKSAEHKMIVRDYYSKRASEYDKQKARTWKSRNGFSERIMNKIVEVALRKNKGIAIDAGIGTGRVSHHLVRRSNLSVLGLDLSKNMLQLARGKTRSSYSRIDLLLADLEYLPFRSLASDLLLCVSIFHYLDSPLLALKEFSRVLKMSGVFVFGEISMHELDDSCFLDRLEKAMSSAHGRYYRPSEMMAELEKSRFQVNHAIVTPYRKSFQSLIEDKANYFGTIYGFKDLVAKATKEQRQLYDMCEGDLELRYLLLVATKEEKLS